MRFSLTIIAVSLLSLAGSAQHYRLADEGSTVKFKIKNLGITITGSFSGLGGQIHIDSQKPENSTITANVDANSINTGIDLRDEHLRKEEYFDVKNYPVIRFVSSRISATGRSGVYRMTGILTIKNVSKEISFPFAQTEEGGKKRLTAQFKINRRDFKVGGSSFTMADNLIVELSVLAQPQ